MNEKLKLSLSVLLPDIPDAQDRCLERLIELLRAKEGIAKAHAIDTEPGDPGELCIHFDPHRVTVAEVRDFAERAGAQVSTKYGHFILRSDPTHARHAHFLQLKIEKITGVLEAVVAPDGTVRLEFDREAIDENGLRQKLREMGISPSDSQSTEVTEPDAHANCDHHHHAGFLGGNTELIFALSAAVSLGLGWLISFASGPAQTISWALYVLAYLLGGWFMVREAVEKLTSGRFEIDFLMLVAAVGAALLGAWGEGALLLVLFSLGHALEHYAMGRAKRAIEALAELAPRTAFVQRDGQLVEVAVEELAIGDLIVVKPNERIAADGFVVRGVSSVNQAPITGESLPVDKQPVTDVDQAQSQPDDLPPQHRVFAGTVNGSGALDIQVTKLASENTLARVVQMVGEAETRTSPTQQFTNRVERYFVPAVLTLVVLLHFVWLIVDEPFSASFYRAMAVLVAASPCALAIATPSAVLSGVARAARGGVLVKGGGPLESLGRVEAIAFDKTGTVTEGRPQLTDVLPARSVDIDELLQVAVAVEALSDHPLAAAVVQGGRQQLQGKSVPEATALNSITGRGVQAEIDGTQITIGKHALFSEVAGSPLPESLRDTVEQLESLGRTTMVVRSGDRYLGVLGLMDTPRATAKSVVATLRELGIKKIVMLSGDNQKVADAIALEIGIDEARGDMMPADKVAAIKQLRENGGVAMVGDGVNDAPAMANATVGIAMGAAGSDVALETADVALMADDLNHLPFAVGLSRQTSRIIRQNLWFSLGMVAILIPSTLLGLPMGPAVLFHEGSTLAVVINALRLLNYHAPTT